VIMKIRRKLSLLLALCMAVLFTACGKEVVDFEEQITTDGNIVTQSTGTEASGEEASATATAMNEAYTADMDVQETVAEEPVDDSAYLPIEGEYYYDLENVVLYLYLYDELPPNYITKDEANALGWSGGSVERYEEGAAIGGDQFGNREGLLPKADGRSYTECDIDTYGEDSRGAKRLLFSNDGLYFYTEDHYESFHEVIVQEDYTVEVME
ncbi:MAG: ribonuclease domain-containing protein, partial [Lachnospiraceae bacterium]